MWGIDMEYFYCDASAIIDLFKRNELVILSQYKDIFHVSNLQVDFEVLYPDGIKEATKQNLTVDITTREEREND